MNDAVKNMDSLLAKAAGALSRYRDVRAEAGRLREELREAKALSGAMELRIRELEKKLDLLASARKLAGGDDSGAREMTRKKLNAYIREIDRCISLLSKEER